MINLSKFTWIAIVLCTYIVSDERGGRDIQKAGFLELEPEIAKIDKELYSKLNQEEHQTKIAGTQMVLAALEHWIGSTWIYYFRVDQLSKLLGLPESYIPAEIIAFGYPNDEMKVTKKKSIDEIIFYNSEFTEEMER